MKFTKMHGLGNDYVYVNCFKEQVPDPSATAVRMSDRHFGIGSDGLILIKPSETADFRMEMYNADGSSGAMCGNGIRCVAKYVYDYGLTDKTQISVETKSGIKYLDLTVDKSAVRKDGFSGNAQAAERGQVRLVRVDMGKPILDPERIPVKTKASILNIPIRVGTELFYATCVSMGNPHCVVPAEDVDGLAIEEIGPQFENHPMFPDRVNTEFIKVLDRQTVQMRVWERGSGETLACGTGACAAAVACILNGWTDENVTVKLRGGDLQITWDRQKDTVFMTGPAVTVFDGEIML